MRKKSLLLGAFLVVVLAGLASLLPFRSGNARMAANKEGAAENYARYCAGCHGDRLEKFTAKAWMDEEGTASVVRSITYGIEELGMPAFRKTFTDKEIEFLAAYVKAGIPADRGVLKPASTPGEIVGSEVQRFVVDTVVSGLKVPWGLAFLPGGDLLISEREGILYLFSEGKLSAPISGLPPVMAAGQGGLLDLCLHPDYDQNGWIYLSYSYLETEKPKRTGNTAIMRARLEGNRLVDQEVIFKGMPATDRSHHFGCKLAFDRENRLYFGIGDRGQHFVFPQELGNHNGKIHRINDDGSIPADNPFTGRPGAMGSIWSYGHRNPQGNCFHPETGELWESEHGPRGGDELNLVLPGKNYGWPVISYGINYDGTVLTELTQKEGLEQPSFYWTPSIAPCGMTFLKGDRYENWKNNLFVGSLRFQYVERVELKGHEVVHREKLLEGIGRVRNVVESPDGLLYVAIETPGKIVRLVPVK
ncbi:MAG TPA: PQQ-dependent sugar dehydrogenase [Prolixibacteraceae bacterium]|nr:PQQ-dependent sugar dehydrogenase [Prolixibacteraceae bacterium]HRV89449.1 PQQ-dependent sugar dehydrogenase [Prolixibacteraceae bacterium]